MKGKSENSLARVADSKAEILIYDLVDWYSRPGRPGRPGRPVLVVECIYKIGTTAVLSLKIV